VGPVALTVPEVLGRREVAAKELGPLLGGAPHLTGAALLGGGNVIVLVDPARLAELARNIPQEGVARPCVLVVDDSQGARQVVAAALAGSGFRAHVAGSTAEALEVMSEMSVQALVVDFSMPGEDGIALVEAVRRTYGNVPTVMLSAVATGDDRRRAQAAGVDAYFDKSDFREGALAAALRTLVAQRARDLEAAP
jgi:CheY-like chemotaxis protein